MCAKCQNVCGERVPSRYTVTHFSYFHNLHPGASVRRIQHIYAFLFYDGGGLLRVELNHLLRSNRRGCTHGWRAPKARFIIFSDALHYIKNGCATAVLTTASNQTEREGGAVLTTYFFDLKRVWSSLKQTRK